MGLGGDPGVVSIVSRIVAEGDSEQIVGAQADVGAATGIATARA